VFLSICTIITRVCLPGFENEEIQPTQPLIHTGTAQVIRKGICRLGIEARAYNPSYSGDRGGRIVVKGWLWEKAGDPT
jgi:hypothetical protein